MFLQAVVSTFKTERRRDPDHQITTTGIFTDVGTSNLR
jgi:hypothetical protein